MWHYLRLHEAFIRRALNKELGELDWAALGAFHEHQLERMQKERLIHLIVTMSVIIFFLLAMGFVTLNPSLPGFGFVLLLLVLVAAYLVHYFRLENGVQRWYHLGNRIAELAGRLTASYEGTVAQPKNCGGA